MPFFSAVEALAFWLEWLLLCCIDLYWSGMVAIGRRSWSYVLRVRLVVAYIAFVSFLYTSLVVDIVDVDGVLGVGF